MRPSLPTALSLVALFIALGGTSYAAFKLPANSVTTRQVKDHSLLGRDFKAGQIPRGAAGPQGPAGAKGDPGSALTIHRTAFAVRSVTSGNDDATTLTCPDGGVAINAGITSDPNAYVADSAPQFSSVDPSGDAAPGGWYLHIHSTATAWQYRPWIVCAGP